MRLIRVALNVLITLTVLALMPSTQGANVLGLFLGAVPSHLIVHMSAAKALAEKGHNVTVVTALEPKITHKNIHNIMITLSLEQQAALKQQMHGITTQKVSTYRMALQLFSSVKALTQIQYELLQDARFTDLYERYENKFDLVLIGHLLNDFKLAVAAKFKIPVIMIWSQASIDATDRFVGNPREFAYVPSFNIALKAGERMNFKQKIQNLLGTLFMKAFQYFYDSSMERYYSKLLAGDERKLPTYAAMKRNISILFCNNHLSEGPIRPFVPGLIEIGGIQIKQKPELLPKDIKDFLDQSKTYGAILFSLGTNMKSEHIKPATVQIIYKTLAKLKQNVIWKWENLSEIPGESPNILYKSWLPQDDILAHPNIKLFITHAGKGGVAEAQYHGVPMLALPLFGDQMANAGKVVTAGYGLQLDMYDLTEDLFEKTLVEVLTNATYAQNVKRFSQLYRDRPLTAQETVVYWSEYVIRHYGAAHMQSPLVHMNFLQASSLDVIAFLCLIAYVSWRILKIIFRFVYKLIAGIYQKRTKKIKSQ